MKSQTVQQLAEWSGGTIRRGCATTPILRLQTYSRKVQAGDAFVALKGERFDGHNFVAKSAELGAVAALVETGAIAENLPLPEDFALVEVENTLTGLQNFAARYRRTLPVITIGVTGSSGKTSTKQLIAAVLQTRFATSATVGNLNNHIGVPLTLLELEESHQYGVVEMGMNHPGELAPLMEMAAPKYGVITNIGQAHIQHFPDHEGIALEKSEVIYRLPADGVAILDAGDVWSAMMAYRAPGRIVWVQSGPTVDSSVQPTWQANQIQVSPRGVSFDLVHGGESVFVTLPLFNRIMVKNALLAAAVGGECGLSLAEIARGLESVQVPGARMSVVTYDDGVTIINDAYNANPDSMQAALTALGEFPGATRRLAVLGSMGELGIRSAELHQQVGRFAARFPLAALILVGPSVGDLLRGAEEAGFKSELIFTAGDAQEAGDALQRIAHPGDVILVKGSHFLGLDSIADKWAALKGAQT